MPVALKYKVMDCPTAYMWTITRLTPGCSQPRRVEREEEYVRCQQLYKLGVPLYTREAILNAYAQLKTCKLGDIINITGIDGTSVDWIICTGKIWVDPNGAEHQLLEPRLCYIPIQALESWDVPSPLYTIPCSLRIAHRLVTRDPITKGLEEHPSLNFEEVRMNFFTSLHFLRNGPHYKLLRLQLNDYPKLPRITKIIGFSCGSMVRKLEGRECLNARSRFQHAFLIALKEYLDARNFETTGQEVRLYVQDDTYLERDIAIIRQFGLQVLQNPEGFLVVDEETLVFSCRPDTPVRQVVADLALPAMMLWDHERDPTKVNGRLGQLIYDPWSPRLDALMRFYHVQDFHNDGIHFEKMDMCIRRPMADLFQEVNDDNAGNAAVDARPVA
ncbi:SRR1 family protein [Aspergillus homomorphus CBS 101889]|uniref:SRR1-like domain-containing protein n=1 Tax=Aspergillus homomorphus (strain CBS 101889) TaxID=1450537 RepID=A0A395HFK0_ASPHC|nr:hypothetical protein BO97DRAFT_429977 [Aspergillus homomorphus CBS 101889]RAL06731.1 hypothetical protein BO97DRAFT_429977 [Aspergillus homomorphus CBS 101889]